MDSIRRQEHATLLHGAGAVDQDVFSSALSEQGRSGPLLVEREAGGLHATSLSWWLRHPAVPPPFEFASLARVREGPVLDIGCATGRHLERLGTAGVEAEGIDLNPHAVDLAREAGCRATCADIWTHATRRRYRWLLVLGNNVGIAGRIAALPDFLSRLSGLLLPGGQILMSSMAPDVAPNAAQDWQDGAAGYPGEMRLRHHYAGRVGAWFDWLYVDPATLAVAGRGAGLTTEIVEHAGCVYLAVLTKRS